MPLRFKKLSQILLERKLDAYLVVHPADIRYLTGIPSSDSWLLVTPGRSYYITDARYSLEVRKALDRKVSVRQFKINHAADVMEILSKKRTCRLGFDERHFSVLQFKRIKRFCPRGVKMIACNGLVGGMRIVKDQAELRLIRQCLKENHAAYQYLRRTLRPGMTEQQVFFGLERFIRRSGVDFSFAPIIASGPNTAFPHARISKRMIHKQDIILIDLGIEIQGYKSDLTRIFVSDKITKPVRDVYKAVAEAQEAAVSEIRSGISVARIDEVARKSLKKNKLDRFFVHALGHGVGLEIHEPPRLFSRSKEILKAGMAVTVEPGVYIPGKFGIRIEDMVLVKDSGCEILSRGSKVEQPFYL